MGKPINEVSHISSILEIWWKPATAVVGFLIAFVTLQNGLGQVKTDQFLIKQKNDQQDIKIIDIEKENIEQHVVVATVSKDVKDLKEASLKQTILITRIAERLKVDTE